jgi:hypothetical protein
MKTIPIVGWMSWLLLVLALIICAVSAENENSEIFL